LESTNLPGIVRNINHLFFFSSLLAVGLRIFFNPQFAEQASDLLLAGNNQDGYRYRMQNLEELFE